MAYERLFQDGYELHYPDDKEAPRGLYLAGQLDVPRISTVDPKTGDKGIRIFGSQRGGWGYYWSPGIDDIRFGIAMATRGVAFDADFIQIIKSGQDYPAVLVRWMEDEYRLDLYVDDVKQDEISIFAMNQNFMKNEYFHVGVHHIGGTSVTVTIDGQTWLEYTDASVPDAVEGVLAGKCSSVGWGVYARFDDFYIDSAIGESKEIPPSYQYLASVADGDGTLQDWAAKTGGADDYEEVDDDEIDDDDTHVRTPSSNSQEFFTTANITLPPGYNIVSAIPHAIARKGTATKNSQLQMGCYNGVENYGTAKDLATWYFHTWNRFTDDPSSNPWSEATFNSNEFGMRTQGTV